MSIDLKQWKMQEKTKDFQLQRLCRENKYAQRTEYTQEYVWIENK